MNAKRLSMLTCVLALLAAAPAVAQEQYTLNFQATCRTTNDAGRTVVRLLSERDLLQACAERHNLAVTNLRALALVYTVGADYNGDAIQIVNRTNGTVVCTPFKLLFSRSVPNGDGSRVEKLVFLYGENQTDAIGSATVSETVRQARGVGPIPVRQGRMQFFNDGSLGDRAGVCTGVFTTGRPFVP